MNLKPNEELDAIATQHMEITGAKEEQARYYLLKAKWDLMLGINLYLNEQEEKRRFEEKKAGTLVGAVQRKPTNTQSFAQPAPKQASNHKKSPREEVVAGPSPELLQQPAVVLQEQPKKANAFEFMNRGVNEKGKLAHLYQKLETEYSKPARSTLGGYVYREPEVVAMKTVKFHPDRLLSFHEDAPNHREWSQAVSDDIEAELDALVAQDQKKRGQRPTNQMDCEQPQLPVVTKGLDIEFVAVDDPRRVRDKVAAPILKEVQSLMFLGNKQNSSPQQQSLAFPKKQVKMGLAQVEGWDQSQSSFIKEAPLFLGLLPSIFRFKRPPRANTLKVGDSFRGERGKVSDNAAFGKGKLSKQDPRRFTIEIIEEGLILGQIEEKASKLLVPLIDTSILTVWIRFASIPNFSSPISESDVLLELFLLPTALTKPIVGLPSKEEDTILLKVGSIKYQLGKLMNTLSILPENKDTFELVRDIATKPLSEWDWDGLIQTSFYTSRDSKEGSNWSQPTISINPEAKVEPESAALESIDPDNRLMKFLNRDLDSSDFIESCEEPASFAKDLKLMNHQKYALSWLRMREGIMPKGPQKLEESGEGNLHPMWCQFNISLKTPQNQRFLENYEQETSASVQGVYKVFFNPYSGQLSHVVPSYSGDLKNFKGGILADEMGLGKTVMMIALLLSNRLLNQQVHILPKSAMPTFRASGLDQIADKDLSSLGQVKPFSKSMKVAKNSLAFMSLEHLKHCVQHNIEPGLLLDTLIVVPTFLAYQWRDEIKKFSSEPVRVLVYSEEEKVQQDLDIRAYDIVIVSYGKLSWDFRNSKSQIHSVYWHRIIIDEAHQIRNRKTWTSKAVCALAGDRRWALTGTPVQNSLEDLYTLVSFMNYTPWSEYQWWSQNINKGLADPDPVRKSRALDILSKILKPVTLRRTKAQHRHLLGLGERSETNLYIQLDQYEQEEYSKFFLKSKAKFQQMMREGAINKCFMHVWPMLMKLRQMCDHVLLTQGRSKAGPTDATIECVLNQIETRLHQRKLMETELEVEEETNMASLYHKKRGKAIRNDSVMFDRPKFREWVQDFYFTDPDAQDEEQPPPTNKMDEERPQGTLLSKIVSKTSVSENQLRTSRFCPVCLAQTFEMEDPIITSCGHIGCHACYMNCISSQSTCPLCSFIIHKEDLIRLPIE